jgi:hypothetical protein
MSPRTNQPDASQRRRLQLNSLNHRALNEYVSPLQLADHYAQLGLKEQTIHFLEEAYKERSPGWCGFKAGQPTISCIRTRATRIS